MPRVNIDDWEDNEQENFRKISRVSSSYRGKKERGITPASNSARKLRVVSDLNLEDYRFLIDDSKFGNEVSNYLTGFEELTLRYRYGEAMGEFSDNFKGLPGENYWLDTSFMIKPNLMAGIHPRHGELILCDYSFLIALDRGLTGLDESYKEMGKEVRKTRKDQSKKLREVLGMKTVYVPQQIRAEISAGTEGFRRKWEENKRRGNDFYAGILGKRLHNLKLLESVVNSKDSDDLVEDLSFEQNLFSHCVYLANQHRTGTSPTDNHLVAYALTKAIEKKEPQIVLTKDWGIHHLTRKVANSAARRINGYTLPKFHLNSSYSNGSGLHALELIPEF